MGMCFSFCFFVFGLPPGPPSLEERKFLVLSIRRKFRPPISSLSSEPPRFVGPRATALPFFIPKEFEVFSFLKPRESPLGSVLEALGGPVGSHVGGQGGPKEFPTPLDSSL